MDDVQRILAKHWPAARVPINPASIAISMGVAVIVMALNNILDILTSINILLITSTALRLEFRKEQCEYQGGRGYTP